MTHSKVHLVSTSKEISELAEEARKKADGRVILVPVDFSSHSREALVFAAELAERLPAGLVVLHVVHDPAEMPGYYSKLIKKKRVGRIHETAAEAFTEFMDSVSSAHRDLSVLDEAKRLMVIGIPVTRILEVADQLQPNMLVVGSHGRSGLQHVVIGSKAAQLVQVCPVPVTVVKSRNSKAKG